MGFVDVIVHFNKWLRRLGPHPTAAPRLTIDVYDYHQAAAILMGLKGEFEPMGGISTAMIDFDEPMRIMGVNVIFRLRLNERPVDRSKLEELCDG